jgi:hypothetical protein
MNRRTGAATARRSSSTSRTRRDRSPSTPDRTDHPHIRHAPMTRNYAARHTPNLSHARMAHRRATTKHPRGETPNDAAGFASCYGPLSRSPIKAFDAGLRPDPFLHQTRLPGLLAAARTGTHFGKRRRPTQDRLHQSHLRSLLDARRAEANAFTPQHQSTIRNLGLPRQAAYLIWAVHYGIGRIGFALGLAA